MMDLMKFITENNLIVVPVLWILGTFLKRSSIKDKYIIWWLLGIGILATVATKIELPLTEAIIQGVLVTGAAVLGHQLLKQSMKEE